MNIQITGSQLRRIGKLGADRDSFMLLHGLVSGGRSFSATELCGLFSVEPSAVLEIVRVLRGLGFVKRGRRGGYESTALGARAIELLQRVASRVELESTDAVSAWTAKVVTPEPVETAGIFPVVSTGTNNGASTLGTISLNVFPATHPADVPQVKPMETETEPASEIANGTKSDAAPIHSYM